MSIERRRNPFQWMNLFDDMENFFLSRDNQISMAVDLKEEVDNYIIIANLPGITKDQISIDVNQAEKYIDIKVEKSDELSTEGEENGSKFLRRERYDGSYSRRIKFGTPINTSKATTELNDGVLTITIPKSEEAKTVQLMLN